jgi:hypothetical protein
MWRIPVLTELEGLVYKELLRPLQELELLGLETELVELGHQSVLDSYGM